MARSSLGHPVGMLIRGIQLLVEGLKRPLNVATRKAKGNIYARIIVDGKTAVSINFDGNDEVTIIVKSEGVVVVYDE